MRKKIKSIGMIAVLMLACISLPTSIISFLRPVETNITENNYYYNETELEIYYTPETITYLNLTGNPEWFNHRIYNLTDENVINWYANKSYGTYRLIRISIIQDYMFDLWNESKSANLSFTILSIPYDGVHWHVEFSDTWHIYFQYRHADDYGETRTDPGLNVTITTIISKI